MCNVVYGYGKHFDLQTIKSNFFNTLFIVQEILFTDMNLKRSN